MSTDGTDPRFSSDPAAYFIAEGGGQSLDAVFPGVDLRLITGQQLMFSMVNIAPHSEVPEHSHPHEQMGILLSGQFEITIDGHTKTVQPGDIWRIPGGVPHRVVNLDQTSVALDVFHPIREDYLEQASQPTE